MRCAVSIQPMLLASFTAGITAQTLMADGSAGHGATNRLRSSSGARGPRCAGTAASGTTVRASNS